MNAQEMENYSVLLLAEYSERLSSRPASTTPSLSKPVMRIDNHFSHVLSCEFHPSGNSVLSSNRDGQIHLCSTDKTTSTLMEAHTGPISEVHFSVDGLNIYSCSEDKTVAVWDSVSSSRIIQFRGHSKAVNCVQGARLGFPGLCSGSKDGSIRIWDIREQECVLSMQNNAEVTAISFDENGEYAFSGGLDQDIKIWDLRTTQLLCKLQGHTGTVTGLSLSPCGSYLLSHSVDNTLRVWDVRPFSSPDRCVGYLPTNQNFVAGLMRCEWSSDGKMISAGTSDCVGYIWDALTGQELFKLAAHECSINDIGFHPKENLVLTASNDNYVFIHDITK